MARPKQAIYIDSQDNDIDRATYESLLAQDILSASENWLPVFKKINAKLLEVLMDPKNSDLLLNPFARKYLHKHSINEFKDILKNGSKDDQYANQEAFLIYKTFFENIFPSLTKPAKDQKENNENVFESLPDAFSVYRPREYFSDANRNREKISGGKYVKDGGILSPEATPKKLKNVLPEHHPAKTVYKRMVKNDKTLALPFAGGASGTLAYSLHAVQQLVPELTAEEYKTYLMALTAHLVYEGHHSFSETGLLIDSLKNGYQLHIINNRQNIDPNQFKENTIFIKESNAGEIFAGTIVKTEHSDAELKWTPLKLTDAQKQLLQFPGPGAKSVILNKSSHETLINDVVAQCHLPLLLSQVGFTINFDVNEKEYYDQFLSENYRNSQRYQQFSSEHHPNSFHGLTWEMLKDAALEIGKKDETLKQFIIKNENKPLEYPMLISLNNLLSKEISNNSPHKLIYNKIQKKMEDSGFLTTEKSQELQKEYINKSELLLNKNPHIIPDEVFAEDKSLAGAQHKYINLHKKKLCIDKICNLKIKNPNLANEINMNLATLGKMKLQQLEEFQQNLQKKIIKGPPAKPKKVHILPNIKRSNESSNGLEIKPHLIIPVGQIDENYVKSVEEHIENIGDKAKEFVLKAKSDPSYQPSANAARTLYTHLQNNLNRYKSDGNIVNFKLACAQSLNTQDRAILEQHRSLWKIVLATATIIGLIVLVAKHGMGLFKTDSGRKIENLESSIGINKPKAA